jgi:hypothetical protein
MVENQTGPVFGPDAKLVADLTGRRVATHQDHLERMAASGTDVDGLRREGVRALKVRRFGPSPVINGFGPGRKGMTGRWKYDPAQDQMVRVG